MAIIKLNLNRTPLLSLLGGRCSQEILDQSLTFFRERIVLVLRMPHMTHQNLHRDRHQHQWQQVVTDLHKTPHSSDKLPTRLSQEMTEQACKYKARGLCQVEVPLQNLRSRGLLLVKSSLTTQETRQRLARLEQDWVAIHKLMVPSHHLDWLLSAKISGELANELSALANGKHGRSEVACYFVVNYISLPSKHEYESHFIGIFIDVGVIGKLKGNFVFTKSTLLNFL